MSRKTFYVCDRCDGMFENPKAGDHMVRISCGNDTPSYPHGDFCTVECAIRYLEDWKKKYRQGASAEEEVQE